MGTQKELTAEQISVLLWLKVLNDYKGEGFVNSSFNEKFEAFEAVEDTGISRGEYDACVKFWITNKVFMENLITGELYVSEKGEKLFKLLEDDKNGTVIADFLKKSKNNLDLETIKQWVKANYPNIIATLGLCLQVVDFVITHP